MHTDGSARGCSGHRVAGGIFCDHSRGVLGCFSSYVGTQFMLYAEVVALILALDIVKEKAWSHAWLECESTLIIQHFKNPSHIPWSI